MAAVGAQVHLVAHTGDESFVDLASHPRQATPVGVGEFHEVLQVDVVPPERECRGALRGIFIIFVAIVV